jgi:hypothetical protein
VTTPSASGRDPQSVAVRVFEIHLATGEALLVNRDAELLGNAVDVIDVEVDERVRSCVAFVLGQVDVDRSSGNGDEPRKARLELMLPLLLEAEPLVPRDGARGVLNVENRDNLLAHAAEPVACRLTSCRARQIRDERMSAATKTTQRAVMTTKYPDPRFTVADPPSRNLAVSIRPSQVRWSYSMAVLRRSRKLSSVVRCTNPALSQRRHRPRRVSTSMTAAAGGRTVWSATLLSEIGPSGEVTNGRNEPSSTTAHPTAKTTYPVA